MKTNRIIIAGSRSCPQNDPILFSKISNIISSLDLNDIEIVCGKAKGADKLGENFAEENDLTIKYFPARWDKFGNAAGQIRNEDMAKYSTHLIAFWDGISSGTKGMIKYAKKYGLKIRIIYI